MTGTRILRVAAIVAVVLVTMTSGVANATITWPASNSRTVNVPRLWDNYAQGAANEFSGDTQPGLNSVAMANNGSINFINYVGESDGAGGPIDYNNLPGRTFKYPYFGGNVAYGGNDAPITNLNATGATPYYDGDCGVMRPHLLTDDFGSYKGAWTPENAGVGATATLAAGGVMTLTSPILPHFNGLNVGDRIQLGAGTAAADKWVPAVFNRTATGAGTVAGNTDPITNAPYWKITGTPAWNQITATPDVATAVKITAASWAIPSMGVPTFTFTSSRGGVSAFQGVADGQRITVSGMTPSAYNGTWIVSNSIAGQGAPSATPNVFTVTTGVNGSAVPGVTPGAATVFGTATRVTDNFYTNSIVSATEAGTTATFTTSGANNGLVGGSVETVVVSGMVPAGYNGTWTVTAATATTFTATLGVSGLAASTTQGIATVNTATATTKGTIIHGSDCARVIYARSTDDGATWDGGNSAPVAGGAACTAGATCGVTDAFNVAGGATGGGVKTVLSEMSTGGATVQAWNQYVFVTFFSISGAPHYPTDVCPHDPRIMYLRVNNNYGAWNAWGAPIRVTPLGSETNYPVFTVDKATGTIYILATDANSGNVVLYKSTDQGGTWSNVLVDKFGVNGQAFRTRFMSPDDTAGAALTPARVPNNASPCVNASRNLNGAGEDSWGYGQHSDIAAYNGYVGVTYIKNLDTVQAKISTNSGVTWTHQKCPGSSCAIQLAAGGAAGLCPGFGCAGDVSKTCPWPFDQNPAGTPPRYCTDNRLYGYGAWKANGALTVAAGPTATVGAARIDFAWVQDGGQGQPLGTPTATTITSNGLYFKEWTSTGGWANTRLVACSQGNAGGPASVGSLLGPTRAISGVTSTAATMTTNNIWTYTTSVAHGFAAGDTVHITGTVASVGGAAPLVTGMNYDGNFTIASVPTTTTFTVSGVANLLSNVGAGGTAQLVNNGVANDPCVGAAAVAKYSDFMEPALAMWGTSGVGIVFTGCAVNPNAAPCAGNRAGTGILADPGSQILYKESGNSGALWGADWSVKGGGGNGGAFQEVTSLAAITAPATDVDTWRISQSPDLAFDKPGDSATGCTQVANGSPQVGCKRYVFFIGHSGGANPAYQNSYVQFLMTGVQS